jgi:hypothetical protein
VSDWDGLNQSELVELARIMNPNVHRGVPREVLIELLEEAVDLPLPPREVDRAREEIFMAVDRFWSQVESLITCPLKTRNPRACFSCTDVQVAECTLLNQKLIESAKEENDVGR